MRLKGHYRTSSKSVLSTLGLKRGLSGKELVAALVGDQNLVPSTMLGSSQPSVTSAPGALMLSSGQTGCLDSYGHTIM